MLIYSSLVIRLTFPQSKILALHILVPLFEPQAYYILQFYTRYRHIILAPLTDYHINHR